MRLVIRRIRYEEPADYESALRIAKARNLLTARGDGDRTNFLYRTLY
jgi:hypothetical protein